MDFSTRLHLFIWLLLKSTVEAAPEPVPTNGFDTARSGINTHRTNLTYSNPIGAGLFTPYNPYLGDNTAYDIPNSRINQFKNHNVYTETGVPPTEQDELTHPHQQPLPSPPKQSMVKFLSGRNPQQGIDEAGERIGVSNKDVMNVLGIFDIERDSTEPLSTTRGYNYNYGNQLDTPRFSEHGGIEAMISKGDEDEGNIDPINIEELVEMSQTTTTNIQAPKKVDIKQLGVDIPTGFIKAEGADPLDPRNPTVRLIKQDEDVEGFVVSPRGDTTVTATTRLDGVYNEQNERILALQQQWSAPYSSKWVVKDTVLWLAGTNFFAYICHISGVRSGFMLGNWDEKEILSEKCAGRSQGSSFHYSGWEIVESKRPSAGTEKETVELVFNNKKLTSLNQIGLFGQRFPAANTPCCWLMPHNHKDVGKLEYRVPRYVQLTTLPEAQVARAAKSSNPAEKAVWLSVGEADRTGNPERKEWTMQDIFNGAPIQIQCSSVGFYPAYAYWSEVDPKTDPFSANRNVHGSSDVVFGSLEVYPNPGIWFYNKENDRIYKWGTHSYVYPLHPKITVDGAKSNRPRIYAGYGITLVVPDKQWTTPRYAYSAVSPLPLVARLMTLGKPKPVVDASVSQEKMSQLDALRTGMELIVEALPVEVPKGPYIQITRVQ
ncbi:hypothetical protein TWF694_008212 [Orbilia ellipsospora]|uniref:Uncharacterized protein n=1 Tax=Orbilia ellipsospora TaxID=2528407 RepID=A0AAV9XI31_9PEZI